MSKLEKVIKDLDELYRLIYQSNVDGEILGSLHDAIALLKEREQKEVKDKLTRIKFLDEYFEGECPSCRSFLDEHSNRNFCGYCGQAVKWK